jgi:hypothetical protein
VPHLSLFSSTYFSAYGVLQPFTGILVDVVKPAFPIAALSPFICGSSRTFAIGCIGRLFVGIGCGPVFVPCCRFVANWFPLQYFPRLSGIASAERLFGLTSVLAEAIGWHFRTVGLIGCAFGILVILFTWGHPNSYEYATVNVNSG